MSLAVRALGLADCEGFREFRQRVRRDDFWSGVTYWRILNETLVGATAEYLSVESSGDTIALVPSFRREGEAGTIVNSLPFFGSFGGVLCDPLLSSSDRNQIGRHLIQYWSDTDVTRVILIEPPFGSRVEQFLPNAKQVAGRLTHVTKLPDATVGDMRNTLFGHMHVKLRNAARKAANARVSLARETSPTGFRAVEELHVSESQGMGRAHKDHRFFTATQRIALASGEVEVYTARDAESRVVAALLLFVSGSTAEYFVPVVHRHWRDQQVMTGLNLYAMLDVSSRLGVKRWHWGGSNFDQASLIRYKARWGSHEYPYAYRQLDLGRAGGLSALSRNAILQMYPHFYVRTFGPNDVLDKDLDAEVK